jgi:HEAT repeat protein
VGKNVGKASDGRQQVEAFLAAHDVPTAAELRALAAAPENALMAIASDQRAEGLIRSRAVAALRLVATQEVRVFLGKLIQSKAKATDKTDRLLVRRAAVALGWMAQAGTVEQLALLFDNEDAEVRLDAAIGLGLTRAAAAATPLRRQLAVEPAPRVRDQIERQLRALSEPAPEPDKSHSPPMREPPMRSGW